MKQCDRLRRALLAVIWCVLVLGNFAEQAVAEEPLRVLFVGNSYTYGHDLPKLIVRMAKAGKTRGISQRSVVGGGMTLARHLKNGKAVERISSGKWDVVVLQDQSQRPVFDPAATMKDARLFAVEIAKRGARTVFFLTWARKKIPKMQDALSATYGSVADELKAEVAPVGEAWRISYGRRPKLNLHAADGSHASPAGAYLAACVFYGTLLDKSPEGSPVTLKGVSKNDAAFLQKTAWEAIRKWRERKNAKKAARISSYPGSRLETRCTRVSASFFLT